MGLKKALKNFLIGKKGSYTGKTTSDLLVESLNSAGGGGSSLMATMRYVSTDSSNNDIYECTHTVVELMDAFMNGSVIIKDQSTSNLFSIINPVRLKIACLLLEEGSDPHVVLTILTPNTNEMDERSWTSRYIRFEFNDHKGNVL